MRITGNLTDFAINGELFKPTTFASPAKPWPPISAKLVMTHADNEFADFAREACERASRELADAIERLTARLAEGIPLDELQIEALPLSTGTVRRVRQLDRHVGDIVVEFDEDTFATTVRIVWAR